MSHLSIYYVHIHFTLCLVNPLGNQTIRHLLFIDSSPTPSTILPKPLPSQPQESIIRFEWSLLFPCFDYPRMSSWKLSRIYVQVDCEFTTYFLGDGLLARHASYNRALRKTS